MTRYKSGGGFYPRVILTNIKIIRIQIAKLKSPPWMANTNLFTKGSIEK